MSLLLKPKLLNMIRFNTQMRVKVINCPNTRIKIWVIDQTSYFMLTRVNLKLYNIFLEKIKTKSLKLLFFMKIMCGKSCLNFDGNGKIKQYRL